MSLQSGGESPPVFSVQGLCKPERQVIGWFDIEERERFAPDNFPVFIIHDDKGRASSRQIGSLCYMFAV